MSAPRPQDLRVRRKLREEAQALGKDKPLTASGVMQTITQALEAAGMPKAGPADKLLPLTLLSDLLDYTPVAKCNEVLDVIERSHVALRKCLDTMASKLALLALCKKLTGRLCASKDTVLHGRVMLVLATFFDMYERSGLNLQGDINQIETAIEAEQAAVPPAAEGPDAAPPVKYDFYALFWGFQAYFSQPQQLPDKLDVFASSLQAVLREFETHLRLDQEDTSSWSLYSSSSLGSKPDTFQAGPITALPKYLTSRRLLPLQLRDGTFRRYVLVQVLVLLHSTRHYHPGKELPASVLPTLDSLQTQTLQCLRKIPPNGELFVQCVLQALERETVWIQWKLDRCPDVKSAKGSESNTALLAEHLKGKTAPPDPRWNRMGNPALSKLWADHDVSPEQMCRLVKQGPTPEAFLREFKEQLVPENQVEPKYHLSKNRLYVWRALRDIARHSLMTFCKSLGGSPEKSTSEMFEKLVQDLNEEAKKDADVQIVSGPTTAKGTTAKRGASPVIKPEGEPFGKKPRAE